MIKIHILPEALIRKIAAGEVIERPASVVKELVENALDASARKVEVAVLDGGQQGIVVADDGCGMSRDDLLLCVERHATSKIRGPADLSAIQTLGFRGEALSSIAAVARLSIETRAIDEVEGTRLVVEGGIRRELVPIGRDVGTTVSVQRIFYNTPARRKFMRQVETEARHIVQAVVQLAAAYPDVAFRLVHQGREVLDYPSAGRAERVGQLLGVDPSDLLAVEGEAGGAGLSGMVTPPALCRRTRIHQHLLVRQRPVYSRALTASVYAGYGGLLPRDLHPMFTIWLDLDPRQVDVNVHPTKREVRLSGEREVRDVLEGTVRRSLEMPEVRAFAARWQDRAGGGVAAGVAEPGPACSLTSWAGSAAEGAAWQPTQLSLSLVPLSMPRFQVPVREAGPLVEGMVTSPSAYWQLHGKYVLATVRGGLLFVDQHAAHERVRYEEVLAALKREGAASQRLLWPSTLVLSPVEMEVYREAAPLLERLGFGTREFGPRTILIDAIPPELRNWGDGDVLRQVLSDYAVEATTRSDTREALAASVACHTSIRSGEPLATSEMEALISSLLAADEPYVCPHGRPVVIRIGLEELDRLFERT